MRIYTILQLKYNIRRFLEFDDWVFFFKVVLSAKGNFADGDFKGHNGSKFTF